MRKYFSFFLCVEKKLFYFSCLEGIFFFDMIFRILAAVAADGKSIHVDAIRCYSTIFGKNYNKRGEVAFGPAPVYAPTAEIPNE